MTLSFRQIQSLDNEIAYNQALITEREQGIIEIETAMLEVNELFRDLGTLAHSQQGLLDHVEANLEGAEGRTRRATRELSAARDYERRRGRTRMVCWILFLLFVGLFLIAFIASL
jgi:t-SNARE complex subunit (syntaxin)